MSPETALPISFEVFDDSGFLKDQDLLSILQSPTPEPGPAYEPDSGSAEENRSRPDLDERKRRRMISNRESARRSRMRKQRHLEGLRSDSNRLRSVNRELSNRLADLSHRCRLLWRENELLRMESVWLRQRLSDIRRVLIFRQLQQRIVTSNEQMPQLIA